MMFHYVEELSSDANDSHDESDDEADDLRNGKSQIGDTNSGKLEFCCGAFVWDRCEYVLRVTDVCCFNAHLLTMEPKVFTNL